MANNDGRYVQYIFALKDNIDVENKVIRSSSGGAPLSMQAGMIIACYDEENTCWMYVSYAPDGVTLVVHDITKSVEESITTITERLTSVEQQLETAATSLVAFGISITDVNEV